MAAVMTSISQAMELTPKASDTLTLEKLSKLCTKMEVNNPISRGLILKHFPLLHRKYRILFYLEQTGLVNSSSDIAKALNEYAHNLSYPISMDDNSEKFWMVRAIISGGKANLAKHIKMPVLRIEAGEKEGFDFKQYKIFVNLSKYKADGVMKEPVCGYDRKTGYVVPKYITVQHTIFRGYMNACYYLHMRLFPSIEQNDVVETLFGKSEFHKSLWSSSDSLATPEDNLFAISGVSSIGALNWWPSYSEQLFDYFESKGYIYKGTFIPRIYAVTYFDFLNQITASKSNAPLCPYLNLDKTISPALAIEEAKKARIFVSLEGKIIINNIDQDF